MHTLCLYVLFTYFCSGKYRFDYLKCLFSSKTADVVGLVEVPKILVPSERMYLQRVSTSAHVSFSCEEFKRVLCFLRFSFVNFFPFVKLCICAVEQVWPWGDVEHIMRHRKHPYNGLEVCLTRETKALHTLAFVMPACNALTLFSLKYLSFCRYLFVTSEKWTLHLLLFQGVTYLQTSILLLPVQIKWKKSRLYCC